MTRVLLCCGVALSGVVLLIAAASFVWHIDVYFGNRHVGVLTGAAHLVRDKTAPDAGWPLSAGAERIAVIWGAIDWLPRRTSNARNQVEIMPLWIPFALVAIPTALLARPSRHRAPQPCATCHYDLTGNTSGICPECGAAANRQRGIDV